MSELLQKHFTLLSVILVATLAARANATRLNRCSIYLDLDVCYSKDKLADVPSVSCHEADLCQKQFRITYMKIDTYTEEIVADLLRICCGQCANVSLVNTIERVAQIKAPENTTSHFIFPVLGRPEEKFLYDYYFIPLIEAPSIYYITHKPHDVMHELLISCINMWPLMVISLLMVIVSGFLGWIMETWSNKECFPRSFLIGWFEGFWWSFISMTTVGYGDKVPKSIAARLFSIFWIFVGITTFSLVTALLSSEIRNANSGMETKMDGAKVGALRYHLHDAMIIQHHGGILVDIECTNATDGITEMIKLLQRKEIDGFVLDRYMLLVFYDLFAKDTRYKDDIAFLKKNAVRTAVSMPTQVFYGILTKNEEDYEFLFYFAKYNRDVFNTCNGLLINSLAKSQRQEGIENPLFSTSGEVFWPAFTSAIGSIIFISIFGVIYEFRRGWRKRCKQQCNV